MSERSSVPFGEAEIVEERDGKKTIIVSRETVRAMGLGDVVKAITDKLGIPQCDGCKERQEALNKLNVDALAALARRVTGRSRREGKAPHDRGR